MRTDFLYKKMDLFQVKADVETQGDFVESLANEVRAASFVNIDDVVAFVNWLDEELSFLVSLSIFFLYATHDKIVSTEKGSNNILGR
jgi:hypothetical protein